VAVSFTWAVEDLLYVPLLLKMGAPEQMCSSVFLSNAVLGLLITPTLAAWSDRIGRRHPFLIFGAGAASTAVCALLVLVEMRQAEAAASQWRLLPITITISHDREAASQLP
jgi:MFS family permease